MSMKKVHSCPLKKYFEPSLYKKCYCTGNKILDMSRHRITCMPYEAKFFNVLADSYTQCRNCKQDVHAKKGDPLEGETLTSIDKTTGLEINIDLPPRTLLKSHNCMIIKSIPKLRKQYKEEKRIRNYRRLIRKRKPFEEFIPRKTCHLCKLSFTSSYFLTHLKYCKFRRIFNMEFELKNDQEKIINESFPLFNNSNECKQLKKRARLRRKLQKSKKVELFKKYLLLFNFKELLMKLNCLKIMVLHLNLEEQVIIF